MRQIHPTSLHEKFVASGVYTHYFDLQPRDVEQWSIYQLPDGERIVRVDRGIRIEGEEYHDTYEAVLLVEVLKGSTEQNQRIERLDAHLYFSSQKGKKGEIRLTHTFFDDYAEIGRKVNDQPNQQTKLDLPKNYIVYTELSPLLSGFAVAQAYTRDDGTIPVVHTAANFYRIWLQDNHLLVTTVGKMEKLGRISETETIQVDNKSFPAVVLSATLDRWQGSHWQVWLDRYDVSLKMSDPDYPEYFVNLTQYARRPDLKPIIPKS